MSDKIVSIRGGPLPEPGQPSPKLVMFLADLLERAVAGEIVGFAGATMGQNGSSTFYLAGFTGGFAMVGALECAKKRLVDIAISDCEVV